MKDKRIQHRIKKMVKKIKDNPEVGKPLRYNLFGLRSIKIRLLEYYMKSERI
ncbi:MAG: hypothetical protein N2V78_04045 [Methanophagales archaeon]|nr:hypothetical protein [Methanophagales archaeon]